MLADQPAVLAVPPGHFTAIIARAPNSAVAVFSTGGIESAKDDDYRLPAEYWATSEIPVDQSTSRKVER